MTRHSEGSNNTDHYAPLQVFVMPYMFIQSAKYIVHHCQPVVDFQVNLDVWHDDAPQVDEPMEGLQLSCTNDDEEVGRVDTLPNMQAWGEPVYLKLTSSPKS